MNNTNIHIKTIAAALRRSTRTKELDEQENLAQRIQIAKLLLSGTSVDETSRKVKAFTFTISDVIQVIRHGVRGYRETFI